MSTAGTLTIDLAASVARLEKDMAKVNSTVDGAMAKIDRSVSAAKAAFAGLGIAVGGGAFVAAIKSQIDYADALADTSEKLGVSTEKLSAYQYAARNSGSTNEALSSGLARLSASIQDAIINKGGEAARTFRSLGVSVTDANGKARDSGAIFEDLSKKFADSADGSNKTAIAMKLMGRSGADLIPTMNGLAESMAEAKKNNAIVPSDFAQKARQFNDGLDRMKENTAALARELGVRLLPALNKVLEAFTRLASGGPLIAHDNRPQIQAQVDQLVKLADEAAKKGQTQIAEGYKNQAKALLGQLVKVNEEEKRKLYDDKKEPTKKPELNIPAASASASGLGRAQGDDALRQRLGALDSSLATERDRLNQSYLEQQSALELAHERGFVTEEGYQQRLAALKDKYGKDSEAMRKREAEAELWIWEAGYKSKLTITKSVLGSLSELMNTRSKRMFEVGKKAAIAEGLISTYLGAQKAFTDTPGPIWVKAAAGIAAFAVGMNRVNNIKAQQFNGGGGGGGGGAVGTFDANPGTGQPTAPPGLPPSQQSQNAGSTITVVIEGNMIGNEQFVNDTLIPALQTQINDYDTMIIQPGSRQAAAIQGA